MEKYPGRVLSKPGKNAQFFSTRSHSTQNDVENATEFTQLEPYIFSGAEFALIPSRDEPFGLVAVEVSFCIHLLCHI